MRARSVDMLTGALLGIVVCAASCRRDRGDAESAEERVRGIVHSEELILALGPRLKALNKSLANLRLPDQDARELFAGEVEVRDLSTIPAGEVDPLDRVAVRLGRIVPAEEKAKVARDDLDLWAPVLSGVDYFENAKFYLIRGSFTNEALTAFESTVGFKALAKVESGGLRATSSKLHVDWKRDPANGDGPESWSIVSWDTGPIETEDAPRPLFSEVLAEVLPDAETYRRARESVHERKVIEMFRDGQTNLPKKEYIQAFTPDALLQHPSVSVVDLDGDGLDDLYVMVRWGKNQLLHNRGDGTFEEIAADVGLDVRGVSTGAAFVDFDNDGDQDLMLARSLERSMYLVNEGGRFVDRSAELVSMPLPYLVTSVSAADYNGDGLVDVYFGTYSLPYRELKNPEYTRRYLTSEETDELFRRAAASKPYVESPGPPNLLLVNRGGRFDRAPEDEQCRLWRATFQGTWSDFDFDGDPDLYVSNDYAPDALLRNDGAAGFKDVARELGGESMMGFGMGVSWGDYDNDGRQDIYVSNMFSKAGMRITSQAPGLDPRIRRSAEGNLLIRNLGDRFEQVSGLEPPALAVAIADWSWGGQFADFDNDGWLDIYVSSGYYTAPKEVEFDVDL